MIVRDYFVVLDAMDDTRARVVLDRYNSLYSPPTTTLKRVREFTKQLLGLEPTDRFDMKVVLREGAPPRGEGWNTRETALWEYCDSWDVEYHPAADILGLELVNESSANSTDIFALLLEEFGVYSTSCPRI